MVPHCVEENRGPSSAVFRDSSTTRAMEASSSVLREGSSAPRLISSTCVATVVPVVGLICTLSAQGLGAMYLPPQPRLEAGTKASQVPGGRQRSETMLVLLLES